MLFHIFHPHVRVFIFDGKTPKRKKAEEKGQSADETEGAPAKKRRAPQKKGKPS